MLHLETLESRCLLSILVSTDPSGVPVINSFTFADTGVGLDSAWQTLYLFNDNLTQAAVINGLSTSVPFELENPGALIGQSIDPNLQNPVALNVRFSPELDDVGDQGALLNIQTSLINTKVNLAGEGIPGDLTVTDVTPTLLLPGQAISGAPLDVSVTVRAVNDASQGSIGDDVPVGLFLSTDTVWDGSDIAVLPIAQLGPIASGQDVQVDITIPADITGQVDGNYYILAVVDPNDVIAEYQETLGLDAPNMMASAVIDFYSPITLTDSVADPNDGLVSFTQTIVGTLSETAYVQVHNHSGQDVLITSVSLEDAFGAPGLNYQWQNPSNMNIAAGGSATIAVQFAPTVTGALSEYLIVETDAGPAGTKHKVTLSSTGINVPILLVTDSVLPANDLTIPFGPVGVGQTAGPEYVFVDNTSGAAVNITDLDVTGTAFSLTPPAPAQQLPEGYDMNAGWLWSFDGDPELITGTIDSDAQAGYNDVNWYQLLASAGDTVSFEITTLGLAGTALTVYTPYGDQLLHMTTTAAQWLSEFGVPLDGMYYVSIQSTAVFDDGIYSGTVSWANHDPVLLNPGNTAQGMLGLAGTAEDVVWYHYQLGDYGLPGQVSLTLNAIPAGVEVTAYDPYGRVLGTLPAGAAPTVWQMDVYDDVIYRIQSQNPANPVNYSIQFTEEATGLVLQPGANQIPVWFTPSALVNYTETLTLETLLATHDTLTLTGSGLTGDLALPAIYVPDAAHATQTMEVAVLAANLGPGDLNAIPQIQFYLSLDNQLDALDTPLDLQTLFWMPQANESILFQFDLNLPGTLAEGQYFVIAEVDPSAAIAEILETNNLAVSREMTILPPPNLMFWDSSFPTNDFALDFSTGISQLDQHQITVINRDPLQTITITDLTLTGDTFSLNPLPPDSVLPGYGQFTADEVVPLTYGQIVTAQIGEDLPTVNPDEEPLSDWYDIYSFHAEEGQFIDVRGLLNNLGELSLVVYTSGGSILGQDTVTFVTGGTMYFPGSKLAEVTVPALYTGTYYVEVYGTPLVMPDTYQLRVSLAQDEIPQLAFTDPLDPVGYTGIVGNTQSTTYESQWFTFNAPYGSEVEFTFDTRPQMNLTLELMDRYGRVLDYIYSNAPAYNDNTIALFSDGPLYLRLETFGLTEVIEYEITLVQAGSALELEPGESVTLPVYFRSEAGGSFTGELTLQTDNGIPKTARFDLVGSAYAGNLVFRSATIEDLVIAPYAQSGQPLNFTLTVANAGWGDIAQSAEVVLYLSSDEILDAGDTVLGPVLNTLPLFRGEQMIIRDAVNIPTGLTGSYYLIAALDPNNAVAEYPDNVFPDCDYLVFDPLPLTPANDPLLIAPENVLVIDSVDDPFDLQIDYGERPLNTYNTEYVWVVNRGPAPVTITSYSLATGIAFQFPDPGSPTYQQPPIVVMPGMRAGLPILFAPKMFDETGNNLRQDTFTVKTSENQTYQVALTGQVTGANLLILEDSGPVANDNKMNLGSVRVHQTQQATFTLKNIGNQELYINNIEFAAGINSVFGVSFAGGQLPVTLHPNGQAGDSALFTVTFSPEYTGSFVDTIIIRSNDNTGAYTIALAGVGVAPKLAVYEHLDVQNDNYLPFGWHPVGQSSTTSLLLVNEGTDTLTLYGWKFENAVANDFQVSPLNNPALSADDIPLAPGASLTLQVTFLAAAEGVFSDTLTITSDDGLHSISLTSAAGQSALPSLRYFYNGQFYDSLSLAMPNVSLGSTDTELLYLNNDGFVNLLVNTITVTGAGFSLVSPVGLHDVTLTPGENLPVLIQFNATPQLGLGDFTGALVIHSTAAAESVVPLSAQVVTPELTLSSTALDFGQVNGNITTSQVLTIANDGSSDLILSKWTSNNSQFKITVPAGNLLGGTLVIAPGQSLDLTVSFVPQTYGFSQSTLVLQSNDFDEPVVTIPVAGRNLGLPITITPQSPFPFYDQDGDLVQVSITDGQALLYLNNGKGTGADMDSIVLTNTNPQTRLDIQVKGGQTTLGRLESQASLGAITMPQVTLNQAIQVDGSLNQLTLLNVADAASVQVSQYSSQPMTVTAGRIGNQVTFDLASNVKTFQANAYAGGLLSAPQIDLLKIKTGNLGADVTVGAGSLNKLLVQRNITGTVQAFDSIVMAQSKTGSILGSLIAQNGDIDKVLAKENIAGQILASRSVGSVLAKQGTFSAVLRGQHVDKIAAWKMSDALVSTAADIGKVQVKTDIFDTHFLAGYDIGMNALASTLDDSLGSGSIGLLKYGKNLGNTYAAAGIMTDAIYLSLGLPLPSVQPTPGAKGQMAVRGGNVVTEAGQAEFGFFAVEQINTKLQPQDNFIIVENI